MPKDPIVWIVLIIIAAVVIIFAVWKRRGVKGGMGGTTFEITSGPPRHDIRVAENITLTRAKAGDVAGIKGIEPKTEGTTEVAKGLSAIETELGDIVGWKKNDPS